MAHFSLQTLYFYVAVINNYSHFNLADSVYAPFLIWFARRVLLKQEVYKLPVFHIGAEFNFPEEHNLNLVFLFKYFKLFLFSLQD